MSSEYQPLTMTKEREAELRPTVIDWVAEIWAEVDAVRRELQYANAEISMSAEREKRTRAALKTAEDALAEVKQTLLDTCRAIGVQGLGLIDPVSDAAPDSAPLEWHGLLSEKVAAQRERLHETQAVTRELLSIVKMAHPEYALAIQRATALLGSEASEGKTL